MRYRELGDTGVMASEIGFGGEWLGTHSEEECVALMKKLHENGVNILDCWMSDPDIRSKIGAGLASCRQDWIVQGHIGSTWQNGQYVRTRDMDKVVPAFEDLLKRLGTDYIDFGMIHYVDEIEDWNLICENGFLDYVKKLKADGTIRHIGLSTHSPKIGKMAAQTGFIKVILFPVNPAFDFMPGTSALADLYAARNADGNYGGMDPERREMYDICKEKGVGITCMKPFAGGRLLRADRSPFGIAMTPIQCIHYCLTAAGAASVMAGVETLEQADIIISYEDASDEEREYQKLLATAPMHSAESKCMYCGHCQPCPQGIDIAMVNKFIDLARMQDTVPDSIREHYRNMSVNADDCLSCGSCESRCPFGVGIVDRMALARELFR